MEESEREKRKRDKHVSNILDKIPCTIYYTKMTGSFRVFDNVKPLWLHSRKQHIFYNLTSPFELLYNIVYSYPFFFVF